MGGIQPLVQAHVGVYPVGFHESLVGIALALLKLLNRHFLLLSGLGE